MIQGLALQDNTTIQFSSFGAHVRTGTSSDQFSLVYFAGAGVIRPWLARKLDPLTRHGGGVHSRGYAQTARGRTWDFIVAVPQSNT